MAVVCGLKKNSCYLIGLKFKIITDHRALKALLSKKEANSKIGYALVTAQFTEEQILHRPQSHMDDVDLTSRFPVEDAPLKKSFLSIDYSQLSMTRTKHYHKKTTKNS